jgi:hypothetical protein
LVAVTPAALIVAYSTWQARRDLAAARAEIDRSEPAWRWDDLQAARRAVPDAENSALRVLEAHGRLPNPWRAFATVETAPGQPIGEDERAELEGGLGDVLPVQQLRPDQVAGLKAEVARLAGPVAALRELTDQSWGRYPIKPLTVQNPVPMMDQLGSLREAARVLLYQSYLQAQEGQADAALANARAIVNVARSTGDEGSLITLLVRVSVRAIAVNQLQRVLAQGQPGPEALAAAQRAVERELAEPAFAYAARGERAFFNFFVEQWEAGQYGSDQMDELFGGPSSAPNPFVGATPTKPTGNATIDRWIFRYVAGGWGRHDLAAMLRYDTRVAEAAAKPPAERPAAFDEVEAGRAGLRPAVRTATATWGKVIEAYRRSEAQLASAAAALAAERFRRDKGRWPESLKELVPAYLSETPVDPYDGRGLRLKRTDDGLVLYSVGANKADDGGAVRYDMTVPSGFRDVGFQLWDADKRRQPAPPKPPKPPPDDGLPPGGIPPPNPSGG